MEPKSCKGYNKGIAALKRESSTLGALRTRREGSEGCLFTPEFNLSLRNPISTKTKVLSFQRTRKPAEGRARSRRFSPGADLRTRPMAVPPKKPPPKDSHGLGASAPLPPAGGSAGLAPTVRSQKRSGRGKRTTEANARKRRSFRPVHRSLTRTPSTPSRRHVSSAGGPQAPVRLSPAPQRLRPPGGPEDARCVTGPSRWPRCAGRSRAERASKGPGRAFRRRRRDPVRHRALDAGNGTLLASPVVHGVTGHFSSCVWYLRVSPDDTLGCQCPFVLCLHPQGCLRRGAHWEVP